MYRKVFLAGATGAIGTRLLPLLVDARYEVFGSTRSQKKAAELQAAGVKPLSSTCLMHRLCLERLLRLARKS